MKEGEAEKVNLNNNRNQEEIQTSKPKKKNKRELPSLPVPEGTTSLIQKDADASHSEIASEPNDAGGGKESKRKIKKGKSKGDTESQLEDAEDNLLHEYQQQIAQEDEKTLKTTKIKTEEESVSPNNGEVGKKKKKKFKSVVTESDVGFVYLLI